MAKVYLDIKDRKILCELDLQARQPLSHIAKKVGLSREVVQYRIKQLERQGIIEGYYLALDTAKLGYMYCRIFLKSHQVNEKTEQELLTFCQQTSKVIWVTLGEGKWDFSIVYLAKTIHDFEQFYDQLNIKFNRYFQNPYVSIAFKIYHFKHKMVYPIKETKKVTDQAILGEEKAVKTDDMDTKIITYLASNARATLLEIAKNCDTTPKLVQYRIQRLEKEHIIIGYRTKLNVRLLGYDYYKIFLSLQNMTNEIEQKLYTHLRLHPNVIFITKPMGTYNLEFEVLVTNSNELHEIIRDLRCQFTTNIIDYETILYYATPIAKYF